MAPRILDSLDGEWEKRQVNPLETMKKFQLSYHVTYSSYYYILVNYYFVQLLYIANYFHVQILLIDGEMFLLPFHKMGSYRQEIKCLLTYLIRYRTHAVMSANADQPHSLHVMLFLPLRLNFSSTFTQTHYSV